MPNRMIREGLLESDRYWKCSMEAQQLFVHMLMLADDFGCISLGTNVIARRCFDVRPTDKKINELLDQLGHVDLIRRYEKSGGAYAFIPRFGQRLQRSTLKNPIPPANLFDDDDHAKKLFSNINGHRQSSTVGQRLDNGSPTVAPRLANTRREVKGSEEVLKTKPKTTPPTPSNRADALSESDFLRFEKFWDAFPKKKLKGEARKLWIQIQPDDKLLSQMLAKIAEYTSTGAWSQERERFIPKPATWLEGEGWLDVVKMKRIPRLAT